MDAPTNLYAPLLPSELLEGIIFEIWSSRLSTDDRVVFMTSSLLVSKAWKSLFVHISFRDVHIPCPSYVQHYLGKLAGYSSIYGEHVRSVFAPLCRSITVKIREAEAEVSAGPGIIDEEDDEPLMGIALSDLLYMLTIHALPNLRTLCLEYENMGFDDIFGYDRFSHFPGTIANIEISFSFDESMAALGDVLRTTHERRDPQALHLSCIMPAVKTLTFSGASNAFIADMIACRSNPETITILPPPSPPPISIAGSSASDISLQLATPLKLNIDALLPIEILESIVFDAWSSPLSLDDRITFMTSFLLVNKACMSIFLRISFRDVHIPCRSYLLKYTRACELHAGYSPIFDKRTKSSPHVLCRSVAITMRKAEVSFGSVEGDRQDDTRRMHTLENLLHLVSRHRNLCMIRINYENMGYDEIFNCSRLHILPRQVVDLEFSFSFDKVMAAVGNVLRASHQRQHHHILRKVQKPAIKNLTFIGASPAFIEDMVACCPNQESVSLLYSKRCSNAASPLALGTFRKATKEVYARPAVVMKF